MVDERDVVLVLKRVALFILAILICIVHDI